jgi:hypothetical protein
MQSSQIPIHTKRPVHPPKTTSKPERYQPKILISDSHILIITRYSRFFLIIHIHDLIYSPGSFFPKMKSPSSKCFAKPLRSCRMRFRIRSFHGWFKFMRFSIQFLPSATETTTDGLLVRKYREFPKLPV